MLQVFCDFDGTISQTDSLKLLFDEFLADSWPEIEGKMHRSEISERQALEEAFLRMPISPGLARDWILERVQLDPSFKSFVSWCESRGVQLLILSGGLKHFIQALLEREGLGRVKFLSNSIEDDVWKFLPPDQNPESCTNFSHCKCASYASRYQARFKSVYIGDGWTDLCPAKKVDFVFAKQRLKIFCEEQKIPHLGFSDFNEIRFCLEQVFFKSGIRSRDSGTELRA